MIAQTWIVGEASVFPTFTSMHVSMSASIEGQPLFGFESSQYDRQPPPFATNSTHACLSLHDGWLTTLLQRSCGFFPGTLGRHAIRGVQFDRSHACPVGQTQSFAQQVVPCGH